MFISDFIGESNEYDKKLTLEEKRPKSWLKSVSAFANGKGGVLFFGVADDETLVGLTDPRRVSEKISEIIKIRMDPIPQTDMEFHEEDGKQFIILRILPGVETPYYYVGDGNRTAFIRIGNESVPAGVIELKRLVLRGSNQTYDSLSSHFSYEKYAFTKLRSVYRQRTGKELEEADFISFGLVDEKGMLTNAGALLADESPMRHSRLFCTRWNSLDKASGVMEALDDKEFSGSLLILLQGGEEFVKNNTKKRWKKTSDGRLEMPDIPERAVLECIVNGLIHRDYLELGSEVHIDIFDDRMEIYSPGGMLDGSFVQDLDTDYVPSKRRNPIIADVFSRMNYMERRGSGFKKIKDDYHRAVNYRPELEPEFYSDASSFWVTLYNLNYNISIEEVSAGRQKQLFEDEKTVVSNEKQSFGDGKAVIPDKKQLFEEEKTVILKKKQLFENKVNESRLSMLTKKKILQLYGQLSDNMCFSRADVMRIIGITSSPAGELIKKMKKEKLIVPVVGHGKGRYRFKI